MILSFYFAIFFIFNLIYGNTEPKVVSVLVPYQNISVNASGIEQERDDKKLEIDELSNGNKTADAGEPILSVLGKQVIDLFNNFIGSEDAGSMSEDDNKYLSLNKTEISNNSKICIHKYKAADTNRTAIYKHSFTCQDNGDCQEPSMICSLRERRCKCAIYHYWKAKHCMCVPNYSEIRKRMSYSPTEVHQSPVVSEETETVLYRWIEYKLEDDGGFTGYLKVTWPIMLGVLLIVILYIVIYLL